MIWLGLFAGLVVWVNVRDWRARRRERQQVRDRYIR